MIRCENLTFTYPAADRPAIESLQFQVERGEIFGFLGPSGAGKSTTQKILIGILRDYRGLVTVSGKDLSKWTSDYYENIGVSFEYPNHYLKLTALENLKYFGSLYASDTIAPEELLRMVNLTHDGNMIVSHFSKGMKGRLSVARALLHNPELLFLDEPTSGLDPVNARHIKDLIRHQKNAGKTIFLTTHDMTVADELCDRVAFLVDGRIEMIDTPRNLKLKFGQPKVRVEFRTNETLEYRDFPLDRLGNNSEFLQLLKTARLETIHTQEATLEQIFIQVTGRSLQ